MASPFKFSAELACESGRWVVSRSDMDGRSGVGVFTSSSCGDDTGETTGDFGLLPSESEWVRRVEDLLLLDPPVVLLRSSPDCPAVGVGNSSDIDMSLVRGEGGMTVTLGLLDNESLSPSVTGALLADLVGLCPKLAREMDMVG